MQVVVDLRAEPVSVVLEDPADCGRFHVAVRGEDDAAVSGAGDAVALDHALRSKSVGNLDGDGEALVLVDAVRRMAAGSVGDTWDDDFAAMLRYAGSKGWLSEDGASIRAHVEWG
jgi:hypothetical protein